MAGAEKILPSLLLISILFIGCKNTNSDDNKHKEQNKALEKPWYKRYTGVIGKQAVVVNLQCSRRTIKGSYYYVDKGIVIDLLPGQRISDTSDMVFTENDPLKRAPDDTGKNTWSVNIQDSVIKGRWIDGDGKTTIGIDLREAYTGGAYPLDVLVKGDSIMERKGAKRVSAVSLYDLIQPSAKMDQADAGFLKTTILHFLGGDYANAPNINDYVLQADKKYFDDFEKLLTDLKIDRTAHEDWEYNFDHTRLLKVLYNTDGMLVLQLGESDRTGGGHMGSHFRNRYACIDMEQKKLWQLKDIMDVDATKLSPLLDDEAHKVFGITKGPLTERLRTETIPLTDNVYITATGVTFCYYPGVIAPEDDDEIQLFIPYTLLKDRLKDDFKKRIQL